VKLFNPLQVIRILDIILLIEAMCFLLCVPVAWYYKEPLAPFIWSAVITFVLSSLSTAIPGNRAAIKITSRDSYLIVTLSWILFLGLGTLPYLISGTTNSFADAFFESCSGFTTTGATIFPEVESLPNSILFWRSFSQWIGGLGIIVLVVIILPSLKITGYQLFTLESSLKEKILPRTQAVGFRLLYIYISLTLAQILLLSLGEMTIFESICHSLTTISTGGFSVKNLGMIHYSAYSQYIVMLFMFLAGISMIVYYYLVKLNLNKIRKNEELWFYSVITLIAGTIMGSLVLVHSNIAPEAAFRQGFFNTISLITTTGFANSDYIYWSSPAVMLVFLLLFTGACTGSTTGGIKIARHTIVIKSLKAAFFKLLHPNVISTIRFNGRVVPEKAGVSILSFIVTYLFIFLVGTVFIVITGPDLITSASAVAASIGNVGPGLGTVGPLGNYSLFPGVSKIILSLLMIVGRVEIIAVLTLFTKSFWKL
jgi:trk system potassium uptake protein